MELLKSQYERGKLVTLVGMGVNLVLIALKIWGGVYARSQALIADGIHSISDLFTDVVVLLGLKWGRFSFTPSDLNLITALLVILALTVPHIRARLRRPPGLPSP